MLRGFAYSGWYTSAMLVIECCFRHAVLLKSTCCMSYTPCGGCTFVLASGQMAPIQNKSRTFSRSMGPVRHPVGGVRPAFSQRVHFEGQ